MATEIERKFLVQSDAWRDHASPGTVYRQGYLRGLETCSVRVRVAGTRAYLNIKSATLGVTRTEYEYPIPTGDAEEMLEHFCERPLIEKTRFLVENAGHTWEVDVFAGDNAGLVVAEVELRDHDEPLMLPPWAGEEVSGDPKYYNVCLVQHPFKDW